MRFSMMTVAAAAIATAALAGVAPAQAQGIPASFLILRVAQGDSVDSGAARTVLLACDPVQVGTHPDPAGACAELAAAGGSFEQLRGEPMRMCTFIYQPVTLAADGVWQGSPVSYRQTFGNQCMADNHNNTVFHF